MVTFALIAAYFQGKGYIFISFILDFPQMIAHKMPSPYHWELPITGEILAIFTFIRVFKRKI